jgi:hypothetical protein
MAKPISKHAELVRALRSQDNEPEAAMLLFDVGGTDLAAQKASRGHANRLHQHLNTTLPEAVRRVLKAHIRQVHASTSTVPSTYGRYNWNDRHVEVFGGDHVPEDTARHKMGHALDHAMASAKNIDQERAVQLKRDRRHAALSSLPTFQRVFNKYKATDLPGALVKNSEEMFAEGFARYHGSPEQRSDLKADAPDLYQYFEHLHAEIEDFVADAKR